MLGLQERLGDPTARYNGRISLNPLVHLDPFGRHHMLYIDLWPWPGLGQTRGR